MSFAPNFFPKLLWLLQAEDKPTRYEAFEKVREELNIALKAVHFGYNQMMLLCKSLWLFLYKEDKMDQQERICRQIAQLLHQCPDLPEMREILSNDGLAIEEQFEPEEETSEASDNAEPHTQYQSLAEIVDYAGFQVLYFRCWLETFCRDFDKIDYLRQNKYLLLVRNIMEEALVAGFLASNDDLLINIIETMKLVIFNTSRLKDGSTPRSLILHIIDVYNSSLHFACRNAVPQPNQFACAVVVWGDIICALRKSNEDELVQAILTGIFDDFTEISFYGDENFGRYLQKSSNERDEQYMLQDCFWLLATQQPALKADFEAFAGQIEDYIDFYASEEAAKYRGAYRPHGLKAIEKEYRKNVDFINEQIVAIAKQQKGDDYERYINKEEDEWEYDPKFPQKAARKESIYLKGYEKKEDDL